jgi:hypothetical protein
MWRIRSQIKKDNHGHPKYWSNEFGWTWLEFADMFTTETKERHMLPTGGEWEEVLE